MNIDTIMRMITCTYNEGVLILSIEIGGKTKTFYSIDKLIEFIKNHFNLTDSEVAQLRKKIEEYVRNTPDDEPTRSPKPRIRP